MKVTFVPEQMVDEGLADIDTLAVTTGFTVMVIVLELAGLPETQDALLVIVQVTVLPFANPASVYVVLLVPTFTPFFFH